MATITYSNCKMQGHKYTSFSQPLRPDLALRKNNHKVQKLPVIKLWFITHVESFLLIKLCFITGKQDKARRIIFFWCYTSSSSTSSQATKNFQCCISSSSTSSKATKIINCCSKIIFCCTQERKRLHVLFKCQGKYIYWERCTCWTSRWGKCLNAGANASAIILLPVEPLILSVCCANCWETIQMYVEYSSLLNVYPSK